MYGNVSVRDVSCNSSASHCTFDFAFRAPSYTLHSPRYEARPVPREMDFEMMRDVVCGAACTTFPPVSWCCPFPAYAIDRISPCAPAPTRQHDGYFIVSFEPRFPSSPSMCPPSCTSARCVTRLYMLCGQFWIVV